MSVWRNLRLTRRAPYKEHLDERETHQPAAPAHDRRHDGAQLRRKDAHKLSAGRQAFLVWVFLRLLQGRLALCRMATRIFVLHPPQTWPPNSERTRNGKKHDLPL